MNRIVRRVGSLLLLAGLLSAGCAAPRDERVDAEILTADGDGSTEGSGASGATNESEGTSASVITYRAALPATGTPASRSEPGAAPSSLANGPVPDPWTSGPVPDPWTSGPVPDPWTSGGSETGNGSTTTPPSGNGSTPPKGKPTP